MGRDHRGHPAPRRHGRLMAAVRGLAALLALAALLVGVPTGLWVFGGDLLPRRMPAPAELWQTLTSRDSGELFLATLTVVGFAAWAIFAASVIVELAARLRGRPSLRLPGCGWAQGLAGLLLAAVAAGLLAPLPASAAATDPGSGRPPLSTGLAAPATDPHPVPASGEATVTGDTQPPAGAGPGPTYEVTSRDTLWSIAERELGDARRYQELYELNAGKVQPDGSTLTRGAVLRPGWQLQLPADARPQTPAAAAETVTVEPGDTLSELADETLDSPRQYPRIFEANVGWVQPDGRALADPHLIYPGWKLTIPGGTAAAPDPGGEAPSTAPPPAPEADPAPDPAPDSAPPPDTGEPGQNPAPAPTTAAPEVPPPPGSTPGPGPGESDPGAASPSAAPLPGPDPEADRAVDEAPAPITDAPAPVAPPPPHVPGPGGGEPDPGSGARDDQRPAPTVDNDDLVSLPTALTVSAILASGLLYGLHRYRMIQQRRRRIGRQVRLPSRPADRLERALRTAAPRADVEFVDLGLRSLAAGLVQRPEDDQLPDIIAAWLSSDELRLVLTTPCPDPPSPFVAETDDTDWVLPAGTPLPVTPDTALQHLAPLPTLASVGRVGQRQLLLDLERIGALRLAGHPDRSLELLRHLAAELAHNRWSDDLQVLLVGFGDELTALNPGRIRHVATLGEAVRDLRAHLEQTRAALRDLDAGSVLAGRVHDIAGDTWMPEVLLVAPDAAAAPGANGDSPADAHETQAELAAVLAELEQAGRSVVAVVAGDTGHQVTTTESWVLHLEPDGTLRVPPQLTDQPLRAEGVRADVAPYLVELFHIAHTGGDQPVPAAPETATWAAGMDAAGARLDPDRTREDDEETDEPPAGPVSDESPPVPRPRPAVALATDPPAPQSAPPAAAADVLARVEAQDPHLDADLTDWAAPPAAPTRPRIAVLGDLRVQAAGTTPDRRLDWYVEVVVYLALHERGVDADKLSTDLWPHSRVKNVTYRQALSTVRTWLGTDAEGGPYLPPMSTDGLYRLQGSDRLLDWELFRRARKRAQARAEAGDRDAAVDDYRAALGLVSGPPFGQQRAGGYAWLANGDCHHDSLLPGYIADTAHELVTLALDRDDMTAARWAAQTAKDADPYRTHDQPVIDLMHIAQLEGNEGELRSYARQLLIDADSGEPDELPEATAEAFRRMLPHGLRPGA